MAIRFYKPLQLLKIDFNSEDSMQYYTYTAHKIKVQGIIEKFKASLLLTSIKSRLKSCDYDCTDSPYILIRNTTTGVYTQTGAVHWTLPPVTLIELKFSACMALVLLYLRIHVHVYKYKE